MIAGGEQPIWGLACPERVASDVEACKRQTMLGPEVLSQARLLIYEEGLGRRRRAGGYVGCRGLVLDRVVVASGREELAPVLRACHTDR